MGPVKFWRGGGGGHTHILPVLPESRIHAQIPVSPFLHGYFFVLPVRPKFSDKLFWKAKKKKKKKKKKQLTFARIPPEFSP